MVQDFQKHLSRRERQVLDIIYQRGRVSVIDVLRDIENPPSYSAVRTTLTSLENKGFIKHSKRSHRFIYHPVKPARDARYSALHRVLHTFCNGSVEDAFAALLKVSNSNLTPEVFDKLTKLIEAAKEEEGQQ